MPQSNHCACYMCYGPVLVCLGLRTLSTFDTTRDAAVCSKNSACPAAMALQGEELLITGNSASGAASMCLGMYRRAHPVSVYGSPAQHWKTVTKPCEASDGLETRHGLFYAPTSLRDVPNSLHMADKFTELESVQIVAQCKASDLLQVEDEATLATSVWQQQAYVAAVALRDAAFEHPLSEMDRVMLFDRSSFYGQIACKVLSHGDPGVAALCENCKLSCVAEMLSQQQSASSARAKCSRMCTMAGRLTPLQSMCKAPDARQGDECRDVRNKAALVTESHEACRCQEGECQDGDEDGNCPSYSSRFHLAS